MRRFPKRWLAADLAAALLVFLLPVFQLMDANPYFKFKYGFDERLLTLTHVLFLLVPAAALMAISVIAHRTDRPGLRRWGLALVLTLYVSQLYSTSLHHLGWPGRILPIGLLAGGGWLVWRKHHGVTSTLALACVVLVPYLAFQTLRHWWKIPRPPSQPLVEPSTAPVPGDLFFILLDGSAVTTDHLDGDFYPDPTLLPNLHRLVREDAHWFYNAVSNGPVTSVSLPSMLTGQLHPTRRNNYLANEETLFSILASRYETRAYLFTRSCFCYRESFAECFPFQPQSYREPARVLAESLAFISTFRLSPLSFQIGRLNEGAYDREAFVTDFLSRVEGDRERPGLFAIQLFDRSEKKLRWFDEFLGRLIHILERSGRYEDATMVIASDHGFNIVGNDFEYGFEARQTRRLYRVPFAIKPPGRGQATISGYPAQGIDLLPTVLAQVIPDAEYRARRYQGVNVLEERPERAHYVSLRDQGHVYRVIHDEDDELDLTPVPLAETRGADGRVR